MFLHCAVIYFCTFPDSEFHVAIMGPTWVLSAPGGPHVGPMNLAIRVDPYEYKAMLYQGKI